MLDAGVVRRGRLAAVIVIAAAILNWIGWTIGNQALTRVNPSWPPMVPWTALLLAVMGVAILIQTGSPAAGRTLVSRSLAGTAGALSAVFLAEYLTEHRLRLDLLWFSESVSALDPTWPGRPSPQTALAVMLLSGAVALVSVTLPRLRAIGIAFLVASAVLSIFSLIAYLFEATQLVVARESTGIALTTALGLLLLALATSTLAPIGRVYGLANRQPLITLGLLVGSFPILVGAALRVAHAFGVEAGGGLVLSTILAAGAIGVVVLRLKAREDELFRQLQLQSDLTEISENNFRLLTANAGDVVCHFRQQEVVWVSPSSEKVLGIPPEEWVGRDILHYVATEDRSRGTAMLEALADGGKVAERLRVISANGVVHWVDWRALPFDRDGQLDGASATLRVVDDQVASEQALRQARRQEAKAKDRYRRSMEHAAIGMCLITPDGRFEEVNGALCELFGYDAEKLKQKRWQDLTAPDYLDADLKSFNDVLQGRIDSYRMLKQYIRSDGYPIWGDLSVSCVRDGNGEVENFISQITDVTAEVQAVERNRVLTETLIQWNHQMTAELKSAAGYMASIMPCELHGTVEVSSRYLPSRGLGGDCFDYYWVDDDHLFVYLIDVSGHGIEPALLSVSVHNLLRSGSLTDQMLLDPQTVLAELNRLFQMDQHGDHYFTMWCGVYQSSTGTLRYASAGAPPALAFNPVTAAAIEVTELSSKSPPVGIFPDSVFTADTYCVRPGCRILLFSDGASEIELGGGRQLSLDEFKNLATRVAGRPDWSPDDLIGELHALTPEKTFEDDCALIQLSFGDRAGNAPSPDEDV